MSKSIITVNTSGHALVVPTRSLANILLEEFNVAQLQAGLTAWIPPVILTWSDLVNELWKVNQVRQPSLANFSLLSGPQSLVLWERVLNSAKREEDALRLLNVMQTAKAAQAARQTCLDWELDEARLVEFANLDLNQFLQWQLAFKEVCDDLGVLDFSAAPAQLSACTGLRSIYSHICLYAFDLQTSAQSTLLDALQRDGAKITHAPAGATVSELVGRAKHSHSPEPINSPERTNSPEPTNSPKRLDSHELDSYITDRDELYGVMEAAKGRLSEQADAKIAIVIPDLQNRLTLVSEIAREVFYPSLTPLQAEQQHDAYRVSLGKPLDQWTAVGVALRALDLLKPSITARDFALLLRSQHIFMSERYSSVIAELLAWFSEQRIHTLRLAELPALLQQFSQASSNSIKPLTHRDELCEQLGLILSKRDELLASNDGPSSLRLPPSQWGARFMQWLEAWQWTCASITLDSNLDRGSNISSEQYQLEKRFSSCLSELGSLDGVLRQCGLSRALEWLNKLCNDNVFLPQAEPAPILISGIYEAIGRNVDVLFLAGMTEDFPAPAPKTAFIPANALLETRHPSANHERHYQQMTKVLQSLLAGAQEQRISYAQKLRLDPEVTRDVSPFFRNAVTHELKSTWLSIKPVDLECFQDDAGTAWPSAEIVKHGMSVFKEQSSCAFKAFASHRLKCRHIDEPEFGLEASAQGTVIHHLLFSIWEELGSSVELQRWLELSEEQQFAQLGSLVDIAIGELIADFNSEQIKLVRRERGRYVVLIQEWLQFEAKRPMGFAVLEKEWTFTATLGGIEYRGIIDRIDATEDGSIVIMDYKTGIVNRSDWKGERLVNPQMPLYYLAHQQSKQRAADGIAYAQVRRSGMAFSELSEDGLLVKSNAHTAKRASDWSEQRLQWQPLLENLADEFLQGVATVDPVNDLACAYCPYEGLCRIKQLKGRFAGEEDNDDSE